jgi:hypothetical protein
VVTLNIPIRIRVDYSCEVMPRWYVFAKHFSSSIVGTIRGTVVRWRCFRNQVPTSRLLLRCSDGFPFRQNHKNAYGLAEGNTTGGSELHASVLILVDR